jgi:hypothetical protein
VIARVLFAEAIDARGLTRRELAHAASERIASLLGLPPPGSAPRTLSDPPDAPR